MQGKQLYLFSHRRENEKGSIRPKVILPLDTLILLAVIIMLLFIISFSMGVERGKHIVGLTRELKKEAVLPDQGLNIDPVEENEIKKIDIPVRHSEGENTKEKERYHVQVASFKKENAANQEAEELENKGYPVVVMKKGNYVVIYVGGFEDENEARSSFKTLKKKYKDCIFRKSI